MNNFESGEWNRRAALTFDAMMVRLDWINDTLKKIARATAIVAAAACVMALIAAFSAARADTVDATGSGLSWSVTIPPGATDITLTAQCVDCDFPDEATVTVNGGAPVVLFGVRDPSRDVAEAPNGVPVLLPVTLGPGENALVFRCMRIANCIRIDGLTATFTLPAVDPLRAWLQAAPALAVWAASREDTDPALVIVCATDANGRYAVSLPAELGALPVAIPPTTPCQMAWCFAEGPGRAAEIRGACQ